MSSSTIALIILACTLVLYMIPKIPLSVTTILAMLAMAMTGIITYEQAFSGFANSATILVAGMMLMGQACFETGLAQQVGNILYKFVGSNEKFLIVMILIIASLLAVFLNGALVVAIMAPIIDSIVFKSGGTITRKHTYFPLGLASTIGNNLTTISATSMITAAALIKEAGLGDMSLFAPTVVNLPALVIVIILYMIYGYKFQQKWFDFPENKVADVNPVPEKPTGKQKTKMVITAVTIVAVVVALIAGINYGACALAGTAVLIATGCIGEKKAFQSISWSTVIIVAGAIGFSKGLEASGAGELVANTILYRAGALGMSAFGICIVLFILGSLLSNIMSDNATVAIMVPIIIVMAKQMNVDAIPLVLSACSGIKVAVATPISVAPMTMVQVAGYRFKDYLKMGGMVNIIALVVTSLVIKLVYFM